MMPRQGEPEMTDQREPPPLDERPPDLPYPDDPIRLDPPEPDPYRGHMLFVLVALLIMVVAWWGT